MPLHAPDPLGWIGSVIDSRFRIDALVGAGELGAVFKGLHLGLRESVAIKFLRVPAELDKLERADFLITFHDEARNLLRLSRRAPAIVQALDVGAATTPRGEWVPYIVMEWLEGETLERDLARRAREGLSPRSVAEAIELLAPAAAALCDAHLENLTHRDIKPANLFLAQSSSSIRATLAPPTLRVLDFGIAKVLEDAPSLTQALASTGRSVRAFTPRYGAPEQFAQSYGPTGPWTDVFAFALVFFEVVSGRPGLEGDDPIALFGAACDETSRPSLAARGIPGTGVDRVLRRALEVDPARRYRTMGAMWEELVASHRASVAPAASAPGSQPPELSALSAGDGASLEAVLAASPPWPDTWPNLAASPAQSAESARGRRATPALGSDVAAPQDDSRPCTILLAELSGFAALTERLDPEEIPAAIDACFEALAACVQRRGGRVDKFMGDCITAVFEQRRSTDNDAERGVLAALEMQAALGNLVLPVRTPRRRRLAARIGINTGRVYVPAGGASSRQDLAVIGDAVNVAAHLQQSAEPGGIVVGRDTYQRVVGLFNVDELAPLVIKGKSQPIPSYRVVGGTTIRHAVPASDFHGIETKFVGRDAEMARIEQALEAATAGPRATFVTLVGPPGTGRSRMLAELLGRLSALSSFYFVMKAAASPLGSETSYGLAASLVRMRFHIHEGDPPEVVSKTLRRGVRWFRTFATSSLGIAPSSEAPRAGSGKEAAAARERPALTRAELAPVLAVLETMLGAGGEPLAASPAPEEAARDRISAAVVRVLEMVLTRAPVVVLCDGAEHADDASLDLLDDLVERCAGQPLLVVCATRPELYERRPDWGKKASHVRIDMLPLAERDTELLVRDRLRLVPELPAGFVEELARAAEGSPLRVQESLHLLLETGVIVRHDADNWSVNAPEGVNLPPTLEDVVAARLQQLDADASALLGRAAVVGRTFWKGALDRLHAVAASEGAPEHAATGDVLARLCDAQLVRAREVSRYPGESELVFATTAARELAYELLAPEARSRLHAAFAQWLEERSPGGASAAVVASSFERGGEPARAADAYLRAAAHSAALGRPDEARRHAARASALRAVG